MDVKVAANVNLGYFKVAAGKCLRSSGLQANWRGIGIFLQKRYGQPGEGRYFPILTQRDMQTARLNNSPFKTTLLVAAACMWHTAQGGQQSTKGIRHAFLVTGRQTYIVSHKDTIIWRYERPTRDGWVLPNGQILLVLSKGKNYGGGVVIVDRANRRMFQYKGQQDEVNTAQALGNGNMLVTEAGPEPCLKEVNSKGKVEVRMKLQCQVKDIHKQTRMARKLQNGNYLVPHLLDKEVCEYNPNGEIVWRVKMPHMPFTAIRLESGNTLIGCTLGNCVVEMDPKGKAVWKLTNDDLPGKPLNDVCGVQRLPNGNTVLTNYRAKGDAPRMIEVTPDKKIVWTYTHPKRPNVHHFQILNTDGKRLHGRPLR